MENNDKCNKEVESALRTQLSEVEETLKTYNIFANASKIEHDKKLNINKTCIGLGYENLKKAGKKHVKVDDTRLCSGLRCTICCSTCFLSQNIDNSYMSL